jgi:hypothetical protein
MEMTSRTQHARHIGRANLAGTAVTGEVYRHQLKPVITKGAETMNTIFNQHNRAKRNLTPDLTVK